MKTEILVAIITGVFGLLGIIITGYFSHLGFLITARIKGMSVKEIKELRISTAPKYIKGILILSIFLLIIGFVLYSKSENKNAIPKTNNKPLTNKIIWTNNKTGYFVDRRDNRKYKIIKIGSQIWMAENLKYYTTHSWCYNYNKDNIIKYGRLYDWYEAKNFCPAGWHLPTDDEWKKLEKHNGVSGYELNFIKKWRGDGAGNSLKIGGSSDLNLILCGSALVKENKVKFVNISKYSPYWTATSTDRDKAFYRNFSYNKNSIFRNTHSKKDGFSVRCIHN